MKIRIAAPQLKQMVDECLSKGDIRSAFSLLKSNSEILQKEFPDWYNKSVLETRPKKDTRGHIKLICDYNEEIKEAAHNGDLKWLSRIRSDAYSKYERNRISEDECHKICTTIDAHIKDIKYSPIFSLIRTNTHPEEWKKYIDKNRTIVSHDHVIIDEILRVSRKRIENALSSKKYDSLSKYIKALRDNFFGTKYVDSESLLLDAIDGKICANLESLLIDIIDDKLFKYDEDERLAIEHILEGLDIITDSTKKVFQEKRRLRTIGKIKSALSHFDFALADSYGVVKDFDYESEKKDFVEKLKKKIYHDYDWLTDTSTSSDLAIKAINAGAITNEEYIDILVKAREDKKAEEGKKIYHLILDLLNMNSSLYNAFLRGLQKEKPCYEDFEIPVEGFYPDYASSYYDNHPKNNVFDNDGYPYTIADALNDGVINFDSLKTIRDDIDAKKEKAALEYKRKIEELRETKDKQERFTVKKTLQKPSWTIGGVSSSDQDMLSLFDNAYFKGVEYIDDSLVKNNGLFKINSIDGLSFGICLDYYTTSSSLSDGGGFNNEYSKLGQMIHDLKYTSLPDSEKVSIINNKLIPIVVEKTRDFSFWNKDIVIVPMPFTKQRTLQPVYEIAKGISKIKHKRYDDSILHKNSTAEAKTSDQEFADGVFNVTYSGPEISILIVDDTYGRGRSLRASVNALRKNPNIKFIYYLGIVKNRRGGLIR